MNHSPVIVFDGICNLCCGWVGFLILHDKNERFRFASLQSKGTEKLLNAFNLNTKDIESIIYIKENRQFLESSAVLEILTDLGGIWRCFGIFKLIPKAICDWFYRFIALRRYKLFGKRASCLLPTPENQKRFLT